MAPVNSLSLAKPAQPAYGSDKPNDEIPIQFAAIVINGRTLSGPNSKARRSNGRIMIPVSIVARALGDAVNVDAAARVVTVRRQTGITSDFDARLGGVRENGLAVLMVSNAGEIIFSPSAEELFLPVEIAAALFDVSISYDADHNTVNIRRSQAPVDSPISRNAHRAAEIYQIDYQYDLNRYSSASSQNLILTGGGRLADGRFHFSSNSDSSSGSRQWLRNATFSLERPNGQRFVGGDFSTGSNLQFLSANMRGGSASMPVAGTHFTVFAGRSLSGLSPLVSDLMLQNEPQPSIRARPRYDTGVFGVFASTNSAVFSRKANPLTFSGGAMRFGGSGRSGEMVSANVNYDNSRVQAQGDFGYGKFTGMNADRPHRFGAAADLTGTFQATDTLALHGRYTHIGVNFLSPQHGMREPLDLKAAGVTWSPKKWLSMLVNASKSGRPGDKTQNNGSVTAAFSITPGVGVPKLFVSHTVNKTGHVRSGAFTLLNASKEFLRLRLFLSATRIKTLGPATINAHLSANYAISDSNSLEISQGFGSRRSLNGQFDWRTANLLNRRLSLSAGIGYNHGEKSGFSTYERVSASVSLPRQTSLQVNYFQTKSGPTMLVSVRGSLLRKREAAAFLDSPASDMNSFGKISGRVYQDVNLNGKFDPGVDRAQAEVKIRVDGNRYVVSDENGLYGFDSIIAGDHKIYLDLLSVRADLTLLGGAAKDVTLSSGRDSVFDFRLARTGRISGRIWLDANENGKFDENEKPLSEIRVVTASGRDTLTDADGNFTIGDLPPGEHVILLDEKTLPEKTMSGFKPLAAQAFPGRETNDVNLAVVMIPAEVKRFGTPGH